MSDVPGPIKTTCAAAAFATCHIAMCHSTVSRRHRSMRHLKIMMLVHSCCKKYARAFSTPFTRSGVVPPPMAKVPLDVDP